MAVPISFLHDQNVNRITTDGLLVTSVEKSFFCVLHETPAPLVGLIGIFDIARSIFIFLKAHAPVGEFLFPHMLEKTRIFWYHLISANEKIDRIYNNLLSAV